MQQVIGFRQSEIEAMMIAQAAQLSGKAAGDLRVTWTVSTDQAGRREVTAYVLHTDPTVDLVVGPGSQA